MISKNMADRLNKHLKEEVFSWYSYWSMSAYCAGKSLSGFAKWLDAQAKEELIHADKFYHYILDQQADVKLLAIDTAPANFSSITDIFEKGLKHERHITTLLNDLMDLAIKENDHATRVFLQWFITEQVEEESIFIDILDKLKLVKDSSEGLFLMDREMGIRTPTSENEGD